MASDPQTPAPPVEDPLERPLFGPSREATEEEMALVEAAAPPDDDEEEALTASEPPAAEPPVAAEPPAPETAPAQPAPGAGGDGAEVISLRPAPEPAQPTDLVADFPALVERVFTDRNAKTTGQTYAGHLRRFLTWCAARGVDMATMPPDTAMTYLTENYPNPVTRNQCIGALRACFDIGNIHGVKYAPQELVKTIRPPTKKEKAPAATAAPKNGTAPRGPALGEPVAVQGREAIAQTVPMEHAATPRSTPVAAPRKGQSAVPSLGGRIRVSKRVDGSEGLPGVPVGALVLIGDYAGHDLDGEGRIESFITNHIRPVYGPKYGQRPAVYYVDRLDNLGNPIPGATLNVPIMPEPTPSTTPSHAPPPPFPVGMTLPAPAQGQAGAAAPTTAGGITGDRFLDYILSEQRRREEEANKRIEELKATATKQGMDPAVLMLLVDRVKPEPLDPQKIITEAKRQGLLRPPREERAEPVPPPPPQPPMPQMGLGGIDPFATPEPPRSDPGIEALTVVLKQQGDMIASLMGRLAQPQQPQMNLADLVTLAKSLAPAAPPPPPESALSGKVMEALISRALAPPEKPKTIAEALKEIVALNEAKELLGGPQEEKPITFAEVVTAAIENAPAIGQAVATVLASVPRAPTLPAPPAQAALPAHATPQPPARAAAAPMPKAAQEAFLALKVAEGEQEIVNHIFAILSAYVQSGAEPWPRAANKLVDDFKKCDTKTEIRAVVTNLFVWSGAKRHMTDEVVERIANVLHHHYSMIYGQLAPGEQKVLKDADGAQPEETAEAQAADEAAAEGAAPVYEEQAPADTVGNAVVTG